MADRKGGLGRGIGALIPTSDVPSERPIDVFFGGAAQAAPASDLVAVPGARFGHLDILSIVPNPKQPRSVFEPEAFSELVHSIRELGVLQPIVVRPLGEKDGQPTYELIMGERRFVPQKKPAWPRFQRLFVRPKTKTCCETHSSKTCTAAT